MDTRQHSRRRAGRALLVAGCLLAMTAGAAPASASAPAAAPGTPVVAGPATVVLPTEERVGVRWSGGTPLVSQAAGDRTPVTVVRSDGRVYAIPPEAMPYVGGALDLSLFDVAALATAETRGARIPVTVTGTAPVPGVTTTGSSTGYLDGAGAASFGAAARAAVARDPGAARAAGTPVPGLTRLALSGAPTTTVHPDFPMETLTVSLVPPAGQTVVGR